MATKQLSPEIREQKLKFWRQEWLNSEKLQAEFSSSESYARYMLAAAEGRARMYDDSKVSGKAEFPK